MTIASPQLLNTSTRHGDAILQRLHDTDLRVVEVGVCRGVLSNHLLKHRPRLHLIMADWWTPVAADSEAYAWSLANGEPCNVQSPEQVADNMRAAQAVADRYAGRATLIHAPSVEAANQVPDASQDMVFLDADHRYSSVVADIAAWLPKVKPGGWLAGHDYNTPGIGSEVAKAVRDSGLSIETGQFYTWFHRVGVGYD